MYRINHNQDIIELLEKLKEFRAEYPSELLVCTAGFIYSD